MGATMQNGVAVPSMDLGGPAQWLTVSGGQPVISNSAPAAPTPINTTAPSGGGAAAGPTPAQQAAAAAQAQAHTDFMNNNTNQHNLIGTGIETAGKTYGGSILDYLDTLKQQQNTINNENVQNELSKRSGMAGVLQMVQHGLQSGGVTLDNNNASNSSAPDALARAYSQLGREQASNVGTQYVAGQAKINTDQGNLNVANTAELRHADLDKSTAINNIVSDASQRLSQLNTMAMYASIPDRVNIDNEIQQIRQQALDKLSSYDQSLSSGISANAPTSLEQNQTSAANLATAGIAPENAFHYTSQAPAQFQNTGPIPSQLPIFTTPKKQTA